MATCYTHAGRGRGGGNTALRPQPGKWRGDWRRGWTRQVASCGRGTRPLGGRWRAEHRAWRDNLHGETTHRGGRRAHAPGTAVAAAAGNQRQDGAAGASTLYVSSCGRRALRRLPRVRAQRGRGGSAALPSGGPQRRQVPSGRFRRWGSGGGAPGMQPTGAGVPWGHCSRCPGPDWSRAICPEQRIGRGGQEPKANGPAHRHQPWSRPTHARSEPTTLPV